MLESRGGGGGSRDVSRPPPPLENSFFFNLHFFSKLSFEPPPDGQIFWIRGTKKRKKKTFIQRHLVGQQISFFTWTNTTKR